MNQAPIVSTQDLVRVGRVVVGGMELGTLDDAKLIEAGVVAAIGPARRASRLDVLEALAYE